MLNLVSICTGSSPSLYCSLSTCRDANLRDVFVRWLCDANVLFDSQEGALVGRIESL